LDWHVGPLSVFVAPASIASALYIDNERNGQKVS
jgi:hypothetical protein